MTEPALTPDELAMTAVDLFLLARNAAGTVRWLEEFAARYPGPDADATLKNAQEEAERLGRTYRHVRQLLDGAGVPQPPTPATLHYLGGDPGEAVQ